MTLKFYQYGADQLVATLELDEAHSSIIERINEPTRLSATLTSTTAPTLQLGARTTYKGVTYYVTKEPTVRKEHSKLYTIETELETVIGLARHVILDNPVDKRSSFDYTATATEHIQLVVDSLNGKKLSKIPAWTRGMILGSNKVKHIKYDGVSAWDALQLIRQTYETDLHIDGTAIDLGIWSDKNNAIELAYGKGNGILSGLERIKHDDTPTPMSLYVTGTKRNMVKGRLTMQTLETLKVDDNGTILHGDSASGRIFSTDKTGQYISEFTHDNGTQPLYTEATYTNEEIYPSHVSMIKAVTKVKDHFEVNSDFDYSKLRIDGEQMQVVFQSGNLAGREFDAKHFASTNRLAIVPKEEDDTTLPNDTLCPKVGDQYIVTGIKLPDKYIKEAQRKLTEEALSHLIKLQQQRYSYKAEIDPVYLHNNKTTIGNKLDVGQYVHLTDQQIAVGDPYIRIISKRTYLDRPYTPEIELSNEVERLSLFDRLIRDTSGVLADREVILGRLTASSVALDSLVATSTDLSERLTTAEGSVQSLGKTLGSQAQVLASQAEQLTAQGQQLTIQGKSLTDQSQRLTSAEQALTDKLDSGAFAQWQAGDYSQRQSALDKALASKQPAGSYALTSQLESHKTATAQSFAELSNHPLTVDKDGFWRIWNLKQQQYVTTQYQSRGRDGQDAGRYLGRAKRIHPDFNGNYLLETEDSWRTAQEGDYVYLVGDLSNRGGDKDTYYIVREHKGNTVWEVYDIKGDKGDTPNLSLDEQYRLVADGVQVSPLSLKGEPGHSPKPDEVLSTDSFRQQLTSKVTSEVTTQVAPVNQRIESIEDKAEEARTIGSNAQRTANDMTDQVRLAMNGVTALKNFRTSATSQLSDLDKRSLSYDQKRDLNYLTFTLKSMTSGSNGTLEGLALQRLIALSGDNQTISAYIASDAMGAVLKAGITGFGTANEREQVAINHNGTGHFGNLYFNGGQIDFKTGLDAAPYLSIGAEESDFIGTFLNNARVIDTPVSISTLTLTSSLERSVTVANDGTRLTIRLNKISVDVYAPSSLRLTLDGETLAEWWGSAKYIDTSGRDEGGMSYKIERTPYEASNLSYERVVKAGNHTVRLEIVKPSGGSATVTGFRVRRRYDTGAQQSVLTQSGLRLFASPDRYFDVDYRKSVLYSAPNRLSTWQSNPYLVRIKGGAKVDKLTADG